jgi:hypothetical protein
VKKDSGKLPKEKPVVVIRRKAGPKSAPTSPTQATPKTAVPVMKAPKPTLPPQPPQQVQQPGPLQASATPAVTETGPNKKEQERQRLAKETSLQQKQPEWGPYHSFFLNLQPRWPADQDTFERFSSLLFNWRGSLYQEEWEREHPDPRPPLGKDPAECTHKELVEYNRGYPPRHYPGHQPDAEWGKVHLERSPTRGKTSWLNLLHEVWEQLGTAENRVRALRLLHNAFCERGQELGTKGKYWEETRNQREKLRKSLPKTRQKAEQALEKAKEALEAYLQGTNDSAPYARKHLDFGYSSEAAERMFLAEYYNPQEIRTAISEVESAAARLRTLQKTEYVPWKGSRGRPQKPALITALCELYDMFLAHGDGPEESLEYVHCLLYVPGIWSDQNWEALGAKLSPLRKPCLP